MGDKQLYDVTIVGGGATGLFTAFYCGMREMTIKLIESGSFLGGKVTQFLPEKLIYDIGGIPKITGDELIEQLVEQANLHHPTIFYNQWIEAITKQADGTFLLKSKEGTIHHSKTVILATGTGRFDPVPLNVDDLDLYEQKSHHYTISHPQKFARKKVMIASNNRVGIDWALTLEDIAEKVYLVNNKRTFQHATDEELELLNNSTVSVKTNCEIKKLYGQNGLLEKVTVIESEQTNDFIIDHLLTYNGLQMVPTPFETWGLKTESNRIVVDHHMATNIDGIFAAGDSVIYPAKTMLIATGYTEGLTAVNSAKKYIDPKAPAQVYSTVLYRK